MVSKAVPDVKIYHLKGNGRPRDFAGAASSPPGLVPGGAKLCGLVEPYDFGSQGNAFEKGPGEE